MKAPPDGYTLLKVVPANTVNDTLYDKLTFNFIRDIAPVAGMVRVPYVLVVNQSVPVTTVPEFIAYAKANPGKLNFASAGVGTGIHMSGELFKMMAGVNMVHVPYRGAGNAMTDLIGGQVQLMFDTTQASIPHIKAGKVRALAVTTAARSELLPELPTMSLPLQDLRRAVEHRLRRLDHLVDQRLDLGAGLHADVHPGLLGFLDELGVLHHRHVGRAQRCEAVLRAPPARASGRSRWRSAG